MKKTSLVLLATALAAPVALAQSSVNLYGVIDTNVRFERNNVGGASSSRRLVEEGAFNGSRWGVRGSEDLGGSLKATFALEAGFDPSSGALGNATAAANYGEQAAPAGRAFGREAWVALSSARLGQLQLGRQYTFAHLVSNRWQPFSNPNMPSLSVFSGHHRARQDNNLSYTNKVGGASFGAQYTFGEQGTSGKGNSAWGVFAAYDAGPLHIGGYAEDLRNLSGSETRHVRGLGGNYKWDKFQFYAGYMRRSHDVSAQTNKVWTTAVTYSLTGATTLTYSHITDDQDGTRAQTGSRKVDFIALDHFLSKRTDIYALVDRNAVKGGYSVPDNMPGAGRQIGVSFGVRHRF